MCDGSIEKPVGFDELFVLADEFHKLIERFELVITTGKRVSVTANFPINIELAGFVPFFKQFCAIVRKTVSGEFIKFLITGGGISQMIIIVVQMTIWSFTAACIRESFTICFLPLCVLFIYEMPKSEENRNKKAEKKIVAECHVGSLLLK